MNNSRKKQFLPVAHAGVKPTDYPLHSPQSRAAARMMKADRENAPKPMIRMFDEGRLVQEYECEGLDKDWIVRLQHIGGEPGEERSADEHAESKLAIESSAASQWLPKEEDSEPERVAVQESPPAKESSASEEDADSEAARERRIADYIASRRRPFARHFSRRLPPRRGH